MSIALPADAIRAAVAASDWDAADALMAAHEAELRAAIATGAAVDSDRRGALLELLSAQRGLVEELRQARDEAGRELDRFARERRGVAAYRQGGG